MFRGFDSRRLHFFGHCANRRCDEPVGGQDLGPAVDAEFVDEELEERLGFLWVSFGGDGFEGVGDLGEVGGCGRACGLDRRGECQFGLLSLQVVQSSL
jgi:hypothetical protein